MQGKRSNCVAFYIMSTHPHADKVASHLRGYFTYMFTYMPDVVGCWLPPIPCSTHLIAGEIFVGAGSEANYNDFIQNTLL